MNATEIAAKVAAPFSASPLLRIFDNAVMVQNQRQTVYNAVLPLLSNLQSLPADNFVFFQYSPAHQDTSAKMWWPLLGVPMPSGVSQNADGTCSFSENVFCWAVVAYPGKLKFSQTFGLVFDGSVVDIYVKTLQAFCDFLSTIASYSNLLKNTFFYDVPCLDCGDEPGHQVSRNYVTYPIIAQYANVFPDCVGTLQNIPVYKWILPAVPFEKIAYDFRSAWKSADRAGTISGLIMFASAAFGFNALFTSGAQASVGNIVGEGSGAFGTGGAASLPGAGASAGAGTGAGTGAGAGAGASSAAPVTAVPGAAVAPGAGIAVTVPAAVATGTTVGEVLGSVKAILSIASAGIALYTQVKAASRPASAIPPQYGQPVTNADGSVTIRNPDGSSTILYPDGRVVTVPAGGSGHLLTGTGISDKTMLIGGAFLALILILR
jgi:hypothetical protein